MSEIRVESVSQDANKIKIVEIMVGNVMFRFRLEDNRLSYTKSKPGAQVHDPAQLWVSATLFRQACQEARAAKLPLSYAVAKSP